MPGDILVAVGRGGGLSNRWLYSWDRETQGQTETITSCEKTSLCSWGWEGGSFLSFELPKHLGLDPHRMVKRLFHSQL